MTTMMVMILSSSFFFSQSMHSDDKVDDISRFHAVLFMLPWILWAYSGFQVIGRKIKGFGKRKSLSVVHGQSLGNDRRSFFFCVKA